MFCLPLWMGGKEGGERGVGMAAVVASHGQAGLASESTERPCCRRAKLLICKTPMHVWLSITPTITAFAMGGRSSPPSIGRCGRECNPIQMRSTSHANRSSPHTFANSRYQVNFFASLFQALHSTSPMPCIPSPNLAPSGLSSAEA